MKLIKDTTDFYIEENTAVAIGKFDGVHLGHKKLLEHIVEAKKEGLKAAVFTFTPSPGVYFSKKSIPEITTKEEKRTLFEKMGVDYLVEYPFDKKAAGILPEEFVKNILLKQMSAKLVVAGEDLSFGYKGMGNVALLEKISKEEGFLTNIIKKICFEDKVISSTYVRDMIKEGNMELVKTLMGEPYFVEGTVKTGNQLGRTMGMPTINLLPDKDKLLPPKGVYFSTVEYGGKQYKGVTNIGKKPTVSTDEQIGVETYIYDFEKTIYGEAVKVSLYHYERPEQKFEDLEQLKAAIAKNIAQGKEYFEKIGKK